MAELLFFADQRMLDHVAGPGHVERPERLRAVIDRIQRSSMHGFRWCRPSSVEPEQLAAVHGAAYLSRILALRGQDLALDPDTAVSPGSVQAACLAAGAAVDAVEAVMTTHERRAFALVRPPGHHAEPSRAMGFCLFNNVAIAAERALAMGCERVLIVDWDVHHGNGTQHHFEGRDDVLFVSAHQFPFYPGTGDALELGTGRGRGYTINAPLPPGLGDGDYAALFERLLMPIAEAYMPDMVLVSAGFDAHARDPLGGQRVTDSGFATLAGMVSDVANRYAGGRMVAVMEGGYDLEGLAGGVEATSRAMMGEAVPDAKGAGAVGTRMVDALRSVYAEHWECVR